MSGLSEKHFKLAEEHGISRDRIIPVSDKDELCAVAKSHGETKDFNEAILGLSIQADDIPGGPDVWIVLRCPVPLEEQQRIANRLERLGVKETSNYASTSNPQLLLAFILLHEIAHNKLKRGPAMDYETKEKEADEWARAELLKHYSVFSG